jgi:hypothetical protein
MDAVTLTRRGFVKGGGALFVSLYLPGGIAIARDPGRLASWLEIRDDNTILVRTGRTETGTGMSGYYAQAIAEELRMRPEAISLLMGDTDRTPDGGYSAGFLTGMTNVRKVAAYAYQALVSLAATRLRVSVSELTVVDGVVSGGGHTLTYGQLVQGQHLDLKIPVTGRPAKADPSAWVGISSMDGFTVAGDPPLKPVSQFRVIGKSHPMPGTPDKVTGKTEWSCAGHVACTHGATGDRRLDVDFRRRARQEAVPNRRCVAEGQSRCGSGAERVGGHQRGTIGRC